MINNKYTSESEKSKIENKNKIILSDNAYAIVEQLDKLILILKK